MFFLEWNPVLCCWKTLPQFCPQTGKTEAAGDKLQLKRGVPERGSDFCGARFGDVGAPQRWRPAAGMDAHADGELTGSTKALGGLINYIAFIPITMARQ